MTEDASQLPTPTTSTIPPKPEMPVKPPRIPKVWPLWLALVLVVIAIVGAGSWAWLYLQTWQDRLDQALAQNAASSQVLNQSGIRYENRMGQLDEAIQVNRQEVNKVKELIDQTARRILTVGETGRTDWLFAEAEYLLRLANQRLHMEKDYLGSLTILQAADEVLAETKEVAVYPIRQALAEEIVSLQSVADIDREGVYLRIEALIGQLESMDDRLFFTESPLLNEPPIIEEEDATTPWYTSVMNTVNDYFVIRKLDEKVQPLPAPEQIYYLRQNLRLMLEQAELALLDKNQEIYEQSLSKAEKWVSDYFLTQDPVTKALLQNIEDLKSLKIDPELPDISESLRLLRNLVESIYRRKGAEGNSSNLDLMQNGDNV